MSKLYNTFDDTVNSFFDFFNSFYIPLSKPNKFNLSLILTSIADSQSVVTSKLSSSCNCSLISNNDDSLQKRFWRFFNNSNINIYSVYDSFIRHIISNISNVRHDELIVTLDHMYTKNNFVTLMFTLKIDKQGIPILFRVDRTLNNCHSEIQKNSRKKLFNEKFIMNAIDDVLDLLKPLNSKIIFLADRWFFNLKILQHIDNAGHFYCFRAKANSSIKFLLYDRNEKHYIWRNLSYLHSNKHHSKYLYDLELGSLKLKCNISISRGIANSDDSEPWYIVSNISPNLAIKKYSYRFGSIEMFFKSQKTNGFYLEDTNIKNLNAFEVLYGVICIASVWLNIIGTDYIKNHNHYKKKVNIRYNKCNSKARILSTFRLGLKLFKKIFNSHINFILKFNFKLYL